MSGRAGRKSIWLEVMTYGPSTAQRSECQDREPNISHPARANSVITHFITWIFIVTNFYFFFLNTTPWTGARGITTKTIVQWILFLSVFELEQETHISSKNVAFVSICTLCCHSFLATKADNVFHFNIFCTSALGSAAFSGPGARFSGFW